MRTGGDMYAKSVSEASLRKEPHDFSLRVKSAASHFCATGTVGLGPIPGLKEYSQYVQWIGFQLWVWKYQ